MTPRIPDNIWSLIAIMGANAIPPRDPNDDDDNEDEEEEEDEDGDDDPAVIRVASGSIEKIVGRSLERTTPIGALP